MRVEPGGCAGRRYLLLGPLEVWDGDRQVPLGSAKQKALLAVLLLEHDQVVSVDRLVDALWGDDPPSTAQKMVQLFVSRLRTALEPPHSRGETLVTKPPGYAIRPGDGEVDTVQFQRLLSAGRSAQFDDPGRASALFRQALDLWRGEPLSDLQWEPFARLSLPRLEELRLSALEDRIDADLAAGAATDLVAELSDLVVRHPLRERFQGQLMLALYRSGRQADALATYHRARESLIEELGIDPSPSLQRLEAAILQQDPSLELPPRAAPPVTLSPPAEPPPGVVQKQRPRRHRWLLAPAAGVVVIAAVLVAVSRGGRVGPRVRADSVAVIQASTDSVLADVAVGSNPGPLALDGGAVWVGNSSDRTLSRIDLRTMAVVKTFGLSDAPVNLVAEDGVVWIGNGFGGTLSRVLEAYDQLSAPFFPAGNVSGLLAVAVSPGGLWVGLPDKSIIRLDPTSLHVEGAVHLPGRPLAIAVGTSGLWTLQYEDSTVRHIDPNTGAELGSATLADKPQAIAATQSAVWVAGAGDDRLWQIDPATALVVRSVPLGISPTALAVGAGAVWVVGATDGLLERIDPVSGELVRTFNLGHPINRIAVANGRVYATVN